MVVVPISNCMCIAEICRSRNGERIARYVFAYYWTIVFGHLLAIRSARCFLLVVDRVNSLPIVAIQWLAMGLGAVTVQQKQQAGVWYRVWVKCQDVNTRSLKLAIITSKCGTSSRRDRSWPRRRLYNSISVLEIAIRSLRRSFSIDEL